MSLIKFFYTAMTHDRHRKCIIILFKKNKKGIIISFQVIFFSFQHKIFNILNKKAPERFGGRDTLLFAKESEDTICNKSPHQRVEFLHCRNFHTLCR